MTVYRMQLSIGTTAEYRSHKVNKYFVIYTDFISGLPADNNSQILSTQISRNKCKSYIISKKLFKDTSVI